MAVDDGRLRPKTLKEALEAEADMLATIGNRDGDLVNALTLVSRCLPLASWERIERDMKG